MGQEEVSQSKVKNNIIILNLIINIMVIIIFLNNS